jgi:hypothetical protein
MGPLADAAWLLLLLRTAWLLPDWLAKWQALLASARAPSIALDEASGYAAAEVPVSEEASSLAR